MLLNDCKKLSFMLNTLCRNSGFPWIWAVVGLRSQIEREETGRESYDLLNQSANI